MHNMDTENFIFKTKLLSLCVLICEIFLFYFFFKLEILKRVSFVFRCFLRNGNEVESCILALVVDNLY